MLHSAMKLALLSDLHGNDVALRAVLADMDRLGVDSTICLGDLATLGPRPREVLRAVRDRGWPCILGNHDDFLVQPELIHVYTNSSDVIHAVDWCRGELGEEDLDFIRTLKGRLHIDLGGGHTLDVVHGTARSHMENLFASVPADDVDEMLAGCEASLVAVGHTHIPMLRQHRGRLVINPGSVGLAFREYIPGGVPTLYTHAAYAIVEVVGGDLTVRFRSLPLDTGELRAAVASSGIPTRDFLLAQYV